MNNRNKFEETIDKIILISKNLSRPAIELWLGFRSKTIPHYECALCGATLVTLSLLHLDRWVLKKIHLYFLYPFGHPYIYWTGMTVIIFSGYISWALRRSVQLKILLKTLTNTFTEAGLKTSLGRLPSFVSDRAIDDGVRELVLFKNGITLAEFEAKKAKLEADVFGFIEEIKEHRIKGLIKIKYAEKDIPTEIAFDLNYGFKNYDFIIGNTRIGKKLTNLRDTPHLLVGGTSKFGKSSFVKQMLVTLYLNNPSCQFTLIDLKNGLESIDFLDVDRIKTISRPQTAVEYLHKIQQLIAKRAELLVLNKCHKIEDFFALPDSKKQFNKEFTTEKDLGRHVIVIDEAAELFLAGAELSADSAAKARRIVAQLAAQGRAVGIHVVVSTQRPEVKVIDGSIKANLQGRLCFYMADNASSMTILDSVRAADLPVIRGRAIWRSGSEMIEVQVPLLSDEKIRSLLAPFKIQPGNNEKETTKLESPNADEVGNDN